VTLEKVAVGVLGVLVAAGQIPDSFAMPTDREHEEQVQLSLSTAKNTYMLGEPVLMRVAVHNTGTEPERLLLSFDDYGNYFKFRFRNEKGEVYSRGTGVSISIMGAVRERDGFALGPDETRYGYRTAYRGKSPGGGLVFPEPGRYDMWCEFTGWRSPLVSNTVQITVRDPIGTDAEAFKTFADKSTWMLVGTQSLSRLSYEQEADAVEHWHDTLEMWPASTYAPYALFFLASHERWHGDPREALRLYERLLNEYEPLAYTEAAEFHMVDCYRMLGADELAGNMLNGLTSKYPGSDLANPIQLGQQPPEWKRRQSGIDGR